MDGELETQETQRAVVPTTRGDSFDIGNSQALTKDPGITNILQDPSALAKLLDINEEQAENIKAAIVGGGAGLSAKFLSKHFGSPIAGAVGAILGGIVADKIFKKKKEGIGNG